MVSKTAGRYRRRRRRGFVLVTMAVTAVGVFGVVGLAIDMGRVLIVKNETQVYCDAAAVAAALALDGASTGIARAQADVAASVNRYNFATQSVSNPAITFAKAAAGPWLASPSPATGYAYARVTATVPVPLYFLSVVVEQGTLNVVASAAAGQIPITSLSHGLAPYTAVSTNTAGPQFGFVPGDSYDIQWPAYNGNKHGCSPATPDNCFVSPPCSGEKDASKTAVVTNWGSNLSGYWGSNSNSDIAAAVLNGTQLAPLAVGGNLDSLLTSGNKASEARYLDERASQDGDTVHNTYSAYIASPTHNGRRLISIALVNPVDPSHTAVIGFGQFLLMANGSPSDYYSKGTNGNDPYCAIYVGPYNIGSAGPGAGSSTGASAVRLVE